VLLRVLTAASLLAAAVHAGLAFHAWRRRTRSPLTLPFIGLCVAFGVSSLTLGLVGFAPSARDAEFWFRLGTPFSSAVPSVSLHVLLALSGRLSRGRGWKLPLIYAPMLPTLYQEFLGPDAWRVAMVPYENGWLLDFRGAGFPFLAFFGAWNLLGLLIGYGAVWHWARGPRTRRERAQARVILWTGLLSFAGLAIAHTVAARNFDDRLMPPQLPVPGLIVALGLAAALFRHRLLVVTPSLALDQVLASLRDMLLVLDRHGRVAEANAPARRALDLPDRPLAGRVFVDVAADPATLADALARMRESDPPGPCVEAELITAEGPMPVEISGSAIRDADGDPLALAVVVRDLRDTRRLQREIDERRRAEDRLAATLEAVADGVVATDVDGRVVLMNPVAERLAGRTLAEAANRPLHEVLPLRDARTLAPEPDLLARAADPARPGPDADFLVGPEEGPRLLVTCAAAPMRGPDGARAGFVLVLRDVTQDRQVEQELARTSRLESVGLLAGGIAHDFNNILTAILGYVEMARLDVPPGGDVDGRLAEAEAAGRRARELTQRLLTFSRGGDPVLRSTDVSGVVAASLSLVAGLPAIRTDVRIAADAWPARVDESQLYQALNNLLLNACQAMPGGGRVTVAVDNVASPDPLHVDGVEIPAGRWVRIAIQDEGVGIPPEHLSRVFDPFFTTRPDGTGLGLSTTHSIVRRHGGRLTIRSRPGHGTTLGLYLPAADAEARTPHAPPAPEAPAGTGWRVLLMDDHPSVLGVGREMLSVIGCQPQLCTDGAEAITAYRDALGRGAPFDAVILDCVVPGGMGGVEAAREILAVDRRARLILSSGYVDRPVLGDFAAHGFVGVLRKPYVLSTLRQVLEEAILAARPPEAAPPPNPLATGGGI
jgi:PAS domain S-box-containing protein